MGLYYDLPIYKDTYDFVLQIFRITKKFTREYKYSLGQDMKREVIALVRNIYRANKNYNKQPFLEKFLDDIEVLKLELRLCRDLKIISVGDYARTFEIIGSIAKQVQWWKNTTARK